MHTFELPDEAFYRRQAIEREQESRLISDAFTARSCYGKTMAELIVQSDDPNELLKANDEIRIAEEYLAERKAEIQSRLASLHDVPLVTA